MDTIFTLDDSDGSSKINLDELYEKKKQQNLNTLEVYNKVLNRIHNKIKHTSRINSNEQFCWYVIPEMIIGIPKYDHGACVAYLIDKLNENGFVIRYTHPNLLFISWKHWVPSYVRTELKKKTGITIDGYGNEVNKIVNDNDNNDENYDKLMYQNKQNITIENKNNDYKSLNSYKPSGNLIYNKDLLKKIEDKSKNN
tara:strand:+ start:9266 stop:9856 length:591 start_codon:yes stop_codon:yes gene_type:complete